MSTQMLQASILVDGTILLLSRSNARPCAACTHQRQARPLVLRDELAGLIHDDPGAIKCQPLLRHQHLAQLYASARLDRVQEQRRHVHGGTRGAWERAMALALECSNTGHITSGTPQAPVPPWVWDRARSR